MPEIWIPFDGWAPSAGYFGEGWQAVNNLAPVFGGWRPWPQFVANPSASVAAGPMVGGHAHLWSSGIGTSSYLPDAATLYTGSASKLFTVNPSTGAFSDVSRAAGYGAAASPAGWRFASVGNDIWAANGTDPLQRRTANAGLFANGAVSTFAPAPRHITTIREHLVVANLSNAGRRQDEVAWSDADDATNFDPPTTTGTSLAGSKVLPSIPGQITGLLGGQYGLVFKRRGIFYMEYAGSPAVFRLDVLSPHVGTAYSSSIINSRYGIFFLGPDGFYQIVGLSEPVKISTPGLDAQIMDTLYSTQAALTPTLEDMQMVGFQFPSLGLVGWLWRQDWNNVGNTTVMLYNPVSGLWSSGDGRAFLTGGDDTELSTTAILTRPYGSTIYDTIAAISWDTTLSHYCPLIKGQVRQPSVSLGFRPDFKEDVLPLGQATVERVLPVFSKTDPSGSPLTAKVTVESLYDPNGTPLAEQRTASDRDMAGWYPFRATGRFFRVSLQCAAFEDFSNLEGIFISTRALR